MACRMTSALVIAASLLTAGTAMAAGTGDHPVVNLDQATWGPAPPSLPPGAELAVLSGDPTKKGHFVIALRGPAGYKIPPHWHSTDEHVTVLSGALTMGMGDSVDAAKGTALTVGGYALMPQRMHHWATSTAPFVIQVQAQGPFDIRYVSSSDDPKVARK